MRAVQSTRAMAESLGVVSSTTAAPAAQRQQQRFLGRRRTYFCGAYWGYGFHEDGVNSALAVARCFGLSLETWKAASTKASFATSA